MSEVWDLHHDSFMVHTRIRNLHGSLKNKLEALTISEAHDSFMLGMLRDVYQDTERTGLVHVFILFDPTMPWEIDKTLPPVAWAAVYHAVWDTPTGERKRVNEVSVFVHPDHRGKGFSTRLMRYAKSRLKGSKRKWIAMPFDEVGKAAYAKGGITDGSDWVEVSVLDELDLIEDDGLELQNV